MFQRAKSKENKMIRLQEIMDRADYLFKTQNYHEITLTTIGKELGITRTALYKYVSSKEEIFLKIIIEKQKNVYDEIVDTINKKGKTLESLSTSISEVLYHHIDFIKYFQILTSILETNVQLENLVEFKVRSSEDSKELYSIIQEITNLTYEQTFHFYLTVLYHTIYLSDIAFPNSKYYEAMKLANLPIATIDFKEDLIHFIKVYLTNN